MGFTRSCAGFSVTAITAIIHGQFSEGYLLGGLIPPARRLNPGRHEQGQHLRDAPPEPPSRLRPRLVPDDGHSEILGHALQLPVQLRGRAGVLLLILHELDNRLSYRRAVERGLVLDLHDLIPVFKKRLRPPTHHVVDARCVLSPVRKPRPSRQFDGGFTGYGLRENVKESAEELRVLRGETLPELLFGLPLPIRDAL